MSTCRDITIACAALAALHLTLVTLLGCGGPYAPLGTTATVAPSAVRAARRAYEGAPPVIPHAPLGAACVQCHTPTGKEVPPLGMAPSNPHSRTPGIGTTANCRQCHVFTHSQSLFTGSSFSGLPQTMRPGERQHPLAPPVVPHRHFLREDCRACHAGPAARPEIRCTHAERTSCTQCHLFSRAGDTFPQRSQSSE